jgi:outer membrane protein assembly factor BamB
VLSALLLLPGGCSLYETIFVAEDEDRLEGTRVAILTTERDLEADSRLVGQEVRLPEPQRNSTWSQRGGVPEHALGHLALGTELKRAWSRDIGAGNDSDQILMAQPLAVAGRIFAMDSRETVSAFDAESGKRLWEADLESEDEDDGYFGGGIAFGAGRIYATTGYGGVIALDADSGERVWEARTAAPFRSAPTFAQGRVFAITMDNRTLAYNADSGAELWVHRGIAEETALMGSSSPAVSGSVVISAYSSGDVVALLLENGRLLWGESLAGSRRSDPLGDIASVRGVPVVDRGLVYAVGHAGRSGAIDLRRGLRAWELEAGGTETPWPAGDHVYLVTVAQQLLCIQRQDGRVRWLTALPRFEDEEDQEDPIRWFGPVLAGGRLFVAGSHGKGLWISPFDGSVLGEMDLEGDTAVAPLVADSTLYHLSTSAELTAYR